MKLKKMFGLRHKTKKWLMTVSESSNGDADFCNETTVSFADNYGDRIYETENLTDVIASLVVPMHWYNSTFDRPKNVESNDGRLMKVLANCEIVEIERTVREAKKAALGKALPKYIGTVGNFKFDIAKRHSLWVK